MRLLYDNVIDASGVVFTAGTYDASFPPANLANEHRNNPYRTGTGTAAEFVIIDLLTAKNVTACILLDHTLTAGDTSIRIQANATNSWGAPSFDQALTWASGTISQVFANQSFRYWRLIFTKSNASEQRDIGRLFLGTYYQPPEDPSDVEAPEEDLSRKTRSDGGQLFTDAASSYRQKDLPFNGISTTQKDAFRTFHLAVKTHKSFFMQIDPNGSGEMVELLYGKLRSMMIFRNSGFHSDGALCWDTKLEFEEAL